MGFEVTYSHQGDAHLSCERVTTIVSFICDPSAKVPHVTGRLICSQYDASLFDSTVLAHDDLDVILMIISIIIIAGTQDGCTWHLQFDASLVCEAAGEPGLG